MQNAEWRRTISKEQPTTRLFKLGVRSEELGVADEEISLPWKVIPLSGEMSATQTKGCPFPEEKEGPRSGG